MKFELLSRPELGFEGPESLKMLLFLLWSLSNFFHGFVGSYGCPPPPREGWGGGGDPQENLSELGGKPLVSKMLIGRAGGLEAKLGAVGKTLRGS